MAGTPQDRAPRYRFGPYDLDAHSGELRKHGFKVKLGGHPVQILIELLQRPGELVTREELRERLWPADTFVDFDHGLNSAINRLRQTLLDKAEEPRYIETVPRRGYRFINAVERSSTADSPSRSEAQADADSTTRSAKASIEAPAAELVSSAVNADSISDLPVEVAARRGGGFWNLRWLVVSAMFVLVLSAAGYFAIKSRTKAASGSKIGSLAVLPLKNLSGDPSQDYLADGITETLIGRLSTIHDLRVISRTSVMSFKNTQLSVPEIARALGADAIVEGSVIREGNHIRVHAQLIRAASDEHFWSESYDRELQDILSLESEVAQAIASKVEVTLTGEEHARLVAVRRVAPEAHENYLKGLTQLYQSNVQADKAGIEKSIPYFQNAIKIDGTFAPAYVGLANAYMNLTLVVVGGDPEELRPKAMAATRKALELDPDLADAHTLLGRINLVQWQWSDSEAEFKRALELSPNDAAALFGYSHWLLCQGRTEEAITWSQRARKSDPLGFAGFSAGWILFQARHYEEAISELRSAIAVNPNDAWAHWLLGFSLLSNGRPLEAIPILDKTVSMMHRGPGAVGLLATAYARAGRRKDAFRLIGELKEQKKKGYVPAAAFVMPLLALGENDQAFEWLERAYHEQSSMMQFLKVYPGFDSVRSDPRFESLLHRVGFE